VVTIPIPFKDSYFDGTYPRKKIDGVKDLILAQIENDSTDIHNKAYPAYQYWRERDRRSGDTTTDRTFSTTQINSSTLFDLSAVYIPKPNENVLKITFKCNQIFLDRLPTRDPNNVSIIDSPIGATSIFSIFDKYTTTPLVNIIAGNKDNFENELKKAYPRLSKMANIDAFPTGSTVINDFELTVEFLKGDGCVVTYRSDEQRTPIVETLPKYSLSSLFSVFAINGYITNNADPANTEFYRYNIQPTQQALNVRENGDYPCYIQVEYGTLQNYIDEDPLFTGDFEYTKNDLSNDVLNGSLEIDKQDKDLEFPLSVTVVEKIRYDGPVDPESLRKINQKTTDFQLVKELEKRGIGRPSTYAAIISTIQERGYVRIENRRFYAEKMGEIVTDRLNQSFTDLMSYDFTANMENVLDQIASGEKNWKAELNQFFKDFSTQLSTAELDELEGGMKPNSLVLTDIDCPTCGRKMAIRTASTGVFLGCSGYALPPKERCKTTINLIPEAELLNVLDEASETKALMDRKRCPICGTAMDSYIIDPHRKLHICGNNPNCDGYLVEQGQFKIKGYDGPIVECDKCGADMHLKLGRFGKYMGCTNCDNTRKILKNGEVAPPKEEPVHFPELKCEKSDAYFVLRDGASGVFMSAHNFPKSRETRPAKVAELALYRDRLPEKLRYLADAPQKDPEGNEAIIRFSRKEKHQYVTSEKNGKATKWIVDYIDGKWVERKK